MTGTAGNIKESRLIFLFEALRLGSLRMAADALDVAPSAVSRQIALLEQEVGLALIERHTHGVKATEAGQLVLEYFREQRSHQQDTLSHLQELRGLRRGSVRIALGEGFVKDLMRNALAHFCRDYPDISVFLDVGGTSEIVRRVSEDEADLGLVFSPPQDPKVVLLASSNQPLQAIVSPHFPLATRQEPCKIADFLGYPLALNHPSYGIRQVLQTMEYAEKIRLNPTLTTNSFYVIRQFVKLQLGVTFLPPFIVSEELAAGELLAIPIQQPILEQAQAHLAKRAGRKLSLAANRMMQYMTSSMASLR